jgi:hypothetical protein
MATSYTPLLGLALPVTGELSGTWGATVNSYITEYLDAAVSGVQTISGTQTAVTLSVANGVSLVQAGATATGSAQYRIINCTGTPASLLTITAPAASRVYVVINGTAQSVKLVGTGPTTGVTLVTGEEAICAWNGSDFIKVASTVLTALTGTLGTANGGTGSTSTTYASLTANVTGTLPVANGGTGVTASTGTGSVMLNTNPTLTNYVESVVAIGNSGTTQTLALTSGTFQTVTMTGNCTFTMPTAVGGKSFTLTVNTWAGSFTATFTSVKFPGGTAPTLTTTASRFDVFTFFSDGTNWYGNAAQNFV